MLQDLVGLAAHLEIAVGSLDADPEAARTILGELQREARRALRELQELATRVSPALLEVGGLVAELRAAASRAGAQARIDVDVDAVAKAPLEIIRAVYFCALDMFERADGAPAVVSVWVEADALTFEIDAESDLGSDHRAPHDRVEALGGRVTITAGSDRTTLVGSLPISR